MDEQVNEFKEYVSKKCEKESFVHHKWFLKYHLEIVEKIANELCEKYSSADKKLVNVLTWLHDFGKVVNVEKEKETTEIEGRKKLLEIGFEKEFVEKAINYTQLIDKKMEIDLSTAPIEVKIVSSADGASHLIGPFNQIWFYDNPIKNLDELMQNNYDKAVKDWNRKIVLPEVKKAFEKRYEIVLEQNGIFPKKFF